MATLRADDGVNLYDEDTGSGTPIVFVHQYVGDPTLEPGLFMKRNIKSAELAVLPRSGHVLNLDDPTLFNQLVEEFFHPVEGGHWRARES
ncbi:MAG: hypothetical protein IT492_06075 [Gammaproteobacteria bacterium]|nr:hypothetical protein [Gammaproteobacteria bacterium]